MSGGRPRHRNDQSVLSSIESALRAWPRRGPLVIIWYWRYELMLALGLAFGVFAILHTLGLVWLGITLAALVATFTLWPDGRRALIVQAWRVITPHRLRTGCAHAYIQSRRGKLPIILFTTSQRFGERVTLWCVAGTSIEDFTGAQDVLAAACWAAGIQVFRHPRHAHVVVVDVIRHPENYPNDPETEEITQFL